MSKQRERKRGESAGRKLNPDANMKTWETETPAAWSQEGTCWFHLHYIQSWYSNVIASTVL